MQFTTNFHLDQTLDLALSVGLAFVLAGIVGAERQWRQRSAGLRTNVLVAIGAAAFVSLGSRLNGTAGAAQLASYVVSGIGFLGAGAIMKDDRRIQGLNTAATVWCSGAIGALSGAGFAAEAIILAVAILAGNTLLRPVVNAINRAPIDERRTEASYEVHVITDPDHVGEVRDLLSDALDRANYPVSHIEVIERSIDATELIAMLVSTSVEPDELDAVTLQLEAAEDVTFASWSVATHG
jgi:putative Mg2+ transporter-C (MgtC) family protein